MSIRQLTIALEGIEIRYKHVKGHQDDEVEFRHLDRWSQLNVIADEIAGDKMMEYTNKVNEDR